MRKTIMAAGMFSLLALGLGCKHTGGECDCAGVPGDSHGHNPHRTYNSGSPVVTPTISTTSHHGGSFESIAAPKVMSK